MQNFLIALLISSVTVSLVALVYMAGMPFLSKYFSEKGRYYAWLIIIIGLIIPFRPAWGNALISVEVPSRSQPSPPPIVQVLESAAVPIVPTAPTLPTFTGELPLVVNLPPANHTITHPEYTVAPAISLSLWQIVGIIWLTGVVTFIAYHTIRHMRFLRMTKRWSVPVTDEKALNLLQSRKSESGITRHIPLYICPCIPSPVLIGVFKPRILLPELKQDELHFILQHELVHYKRKDLLIKHLVLVATALHWFNPVVHLIAKAVNSSSETSCDAEVMQSADFRTRFAYTETIIGIMRQKSKLQTALATNLYGGKKGMKKRISSIMDMKNKRTGIALASILLVSALIVGGLVVQAESNGDDYDYDYDYSGYGYEYSNYEYVQPELRDAIHAFEHHPFGTYEAFGLSVDNDNGLMFNDEVVRYFEDAKHLPCGQVHTLRYFNSNGTAYLFTVREGYDDFPLVWGGPPTHTLQGIARFTQEQIEAKNIDNRVRQQFGTDPDTIAWEWEIANDERPQTRTEVKDEVYGDQTLPQSESEETLSGETPSGASVKEISVDMFAAGPIAAGQGWFLPSTLPDIFPEEAVCQAWFEAWLEIYGDQIREDILNHVVTPAEHQTLFDCDSLYQIYALHDEAVRDGILATSLMDNGFWFIVLNEIHFTRLDPSMSMDDIMVSVNSQRQVDLIPVEERVITTFDIDEESVVAGFDTDEIVEFTFLSEEFYDHFEMNAAVITLYGINVMFQVTISLSGEFSFSPIEGTVDGLLQHIYIPASEDE